MNLTDRLANFMLIYARLVAQEVFVYGERCLNWSVSDQIQLNLFDVLERVHGFTLIWTNVLKRKRILIFELKVLN